jgi:hypothetical protein
MAQSGMAEAANGCPASKVGQSIPDNLANSHFENLKYKMSIYRILSIIGRV